MAGEQKTTMPRAEQGEQAVLLRHAANELASVPEGLPG